MSFFWTVFLLYFAYAIGIYLGLPENVRKSLREESETESDSSSGLALLLLVAAAIVVTVT